MLLRRHGPGSVQRGVYWGRRPSEANPQLSDFVRHAGGDGGIRTLDRALQPYNGLANRRLQPLGHVSRSSARRDICPTHPPNASARPSSLAWCWRSDWSRGELASPATDRSEPALRCQQCRRRRASFRPCQTRDSFHPCWRRLMIETARVFATARSVSYQASPSRGRRAYRAKASALRLTQLAMPSHGQTQATRFERETRTG